MTILWLDTETRSRCDLKTKGSYNYARDASTELLCLSYAFDDEEVQSWAPGQPFPQRVADHFANGGQIRVHNANFDRLILWYVLCPDNILPSPKPEQFYCTAAQARANCAPGSLEDVGRFASTDMRKDHRGAQLIRLLCVPQADGKFRNDENLMQEMIEYCEQDVRTMRAVSKAMRDLSADELRDYHINEQINDRGVRIDLPLALAAQRYAAQELEDIEATVKDVTGGVITSVRSPRMREWVLERVGPVAKQLMVVHKDGEQKYSIDKTVRANLLALAKENPLEVPSDVAEVIKCADDLWASSVAKFSRMAHLADVEDRRVRGAFVFAGGSATGRASSFGLQVHNFTRTCADDPEAVRQAMVRGHQIVPAFGKRVTDVLRGMLRPALIPEHGKRFVVADWSSIEARVTPWLSGNGKDKLDIFASGRDVYKVNAAATFHTTYDDVTKAQRQIGKVQELACFGPETKVLTSNGVKAIVDVQLDDQLWDGVEWVTHQGVIYKGQRQVISVCGIAVTPDHLIKTGAIWTQAQGLVSNKLLLTQALVTGSANLPSWAMSALGRAPLGLGMYKFNARAVLNLIWFICTTFSKARLRDALPAQKRHRDFGEKIFLSMPMLAPTMTIDGGYSTGYLLAKTDATTPKIEAIQTTAAGGYIYLSPGALTKPRFSDTFLRLTGGINRILSWTASTSTKVMSRAICGLLRAKSIETINAKSKTCNGTSSNLRPVYDILNSGSRNRFTILTEQGPLIVHNCGFAGGVGAFAAMGRIYGVVMAEHEAKRMVDGWRRANPWAVPYWQDLEEAYTRAMRNPGHEFKAGRVFYLYDRQHLWYALPSGRILCYPYARLDADGVSYAKASWKPAADAKEWPRARLWRGLACENITQATANDILRYALRQLDDVVLHVHDEIVLETDRVDAAEVLERVMTTPPLWATDLPLAAEVQEMTRYGK